MPHPDTFFFFILLSANLTRYVHLLISYRGLFLFEGVYGLRRAVHNLAHRLMSMSPDSSYELMLPTICLRHIG